MDVFGMVIIVHEVEICQNQTLLIGEKKLNVLKGETEKIILS